MPNKYIFFLFLTVFFFPFKNFYNNIKKDVKATIRIQLHKSIVKTAVVKTHAHTQRKIIIIIKAIPTSLPKE